MRRCIESAVLAALLLLPADGCSIGIVIRVFNNTRSVVSFTAQEYTVLPGESESFGLEAPLTAQGPGCESSYELRRVPLPQEQYERRLGGLLNPAEFVFQLEEDGQLYALRVTDEPPVDVGSYAQPEGYPIVPTTTGRCDWGAR